MDPKKQQEFYNKLSQVIRSGLESQVDVQRRIQLAKLRRNDLYWNGYHYQAPTLVNGQPTYVPVGSIMATRGENTDGRGAYDYVLNYYQGDGLKLIGVLGRLPNATAMPNGTSDVNEQRSALANQIIERLYSHWDLESLQPELVFSLYKDGTSWLYTPFVVNAQKYGTRRVPVVELKEGLIEPATYSCASCGNVVEFPQPEMVACPQCGTPVDPAGFREAQYGPIPTQIGENVYDNGSVECYLCNGYTVTTPFEIKDVDHCPWLRYEYDEFKGAIMEAYPEVRANRSKFAAPAGDGNNTWSMEKQAREQAASPNHLTFYNRRELWRLTRFWLTPSCYPLLLEDNAEEYYDYLKTNFPNGVKVTKVNGHIVRLEHEALASVWSVCKPTVGEYLYPDALGDNYIRVNRLIDDMANIQAQTAERSIPINLFDPQVLDIRAIQKFAGAPGEFIPTLPGVRGTLRDAIYSTTPAELVNTVPQTAENFLNAGREITGITAPIFGGDQGSQTLGEAEIKRNQALQQHTTTWTNIRKCIARAYENAIFQFAQNSVDQMYFKVSKGMPAETMEVDPAELESLLEGGWHVESDEAIPMTWGQRRAQWWQIADKGPDFWAMVGLQEPDNVSAMLRALGNDDLKLPMQAGVEKALITIGNLLQQQPIEQMDQFTGAPIMLPSIQADQFEDDHNLMVKVVKEWASSKEVVRNGGIRQINPAGYANVIAWGRAHQQMAMAEMMPQMEPMMDGGAPPPNGAAPTVPSSGVPQIPPAQAPEELGAPTLESQEAVDLGAPPMQ